MIEKQQENHETEKYTDSCGRHRKIKEVLSRPVPFGCDPGSGWESDRDGNTDVGGKKLCGTGLYERQTTEYMLLIYIPQSIFI